MPQVLRASHAKPWRHCSDSERLDPDNGLPLVATLDALFDAGLITFDAGGCMEISTHLDENQQASLLSGAPRTLSRYYEGSKGKAGGVKRNRHPFSS